MAGGALREILASFGIEVDDKQLKKGEHGVHSFTETLKEFGEGLLTAFAVERVVEFTKELLEGADVLAKQSQALSVSAEELQGWQWAAKLSGSSAEEFSDAFTKFNRNVAAAAAGTGPAADALKALGVSVKDSTGAMGQPIDLLDGVADGLVAMQDPAKRTEAIMALFGKSGARLLPLFLEGAEGIKKLRAEVGELGAGFDEAFLENAQEVNDNLDRLKLGLKGIAIQGLGELLPGLVELQTKGIAAIKWVIDLLKHSNALKAGLASFGIFGAVKAASGLIMLAQKAGFLKAGLRGLLLQLLPLVAAFLVLEDVWTFLSGGKSLTGDLLAKFFGKDAPGKVREFAAALKATGIADFAALLHEAFAIFSSKEPLDKKFKDLLAYIDGPFLTQMQKDFGGIGQEIAIWTDLLVGVMAVITRIIGGMVWIADHAIVKPIGSAVFHAQDEQANINAQVAAGKKPATKEDVQAHLDSGPWYMKALAKLVGFKPENAVPVDLRRQVAEQSGVAHAPAAFGPLAPPPTQVHNETTVVQHFDASTPKDVLKAASDGAKAGTSEGNNLRTKRALVPTAG
jgi:hypothetical protein